MLFSEKQKSILTLLADGCFHSGTELAEALGVSRSAICKHLKALSELGIAHSAVSGKGYKLDKALELLAHSPIAAQLSLNSLAAISRIELHDSLASTNTYLLEQAQHQAPSGLVCLAEQQTAGKGRRGRQWVSPYGSNIYLSILWRFQQGGMASTQGLSLAVGVAVIRALRQLGIGEVGLKWPNDIYSGGKKLGGILIEVSGEADGPCTAVIGLGLNMYVPDSAAQGITQAWTDLQQIMAGQRISRNGLAGRLIDELLTVVNGYEQRGLKAYVEEWRSYDCLQGHAATLYLGQQTLNGTVLGIDDNGLLLLAKADGNNQAFASGEVSFNQAGL